MSLSSIIEQLRPRPRRLGACVVWAPASERGILELALGEVADVVPIATLQDLAEHCRSGSAQAAVLSLTQISTTDVRRLAAIAAGFPAVRLVGVCMPGSNGHALTGAHTLGRSGVTALVDCTVPAGFDRLRRAVSVSMENDFLDVAVERCSEAAEATIATREFLANCFRRGVWGINDLTCFSGSNISTVLSRAFRLQLPSPKTWVVRARLVEFASLGESPGNSLTDIAGRMGASSSQSLGRFVRTHTDTTAEQFRERMNGEQACDWYIETLIIPHKEKLNRFNELARPYRRSA